MRTLSTFRRARELRDRIGKVRRGYVELQMRDESRRVERRKEANERLRKLGLKPLPPIRRTIPYDP